MLSKLFLLIAAPENMPSHNVEKSNYLLQHLGQSWLELSIFLQISKIYLLDLFLLLLF